MPRRGIASTCLAMTTPIRQNLPPRSSTTGAMFIILAALLFSIVPFSLGLGPWSAALSILLLVAAVLVHELQAVHISFFTAGFIIMPILFPIFRSWPFNLLIPFMLYLTTAVVITALRKSIFWTRAGRFDRDIAALVIVTAIISGIALYGWYRAFKPDLSIHLGYMPDMPLWLYPLAGLGYSTGNALLEELVFRGIFMQALDSAFGPAVISLVAQAWLFATVHYVQGFPNGAWGLAMTFVYGVMLGVIRRRSQGLFAPWVAHLCSDIVIFAILAANVIAQ